MIDLLEGNLNLNKVEQENNKIFLSILKPNKSFLKNSKLHGEINAIISPSFFNKYKNFLN